MITLSLRQRLLVPGLPALSVGSSQVHSSLAPALSLTVLTLWSFALRLTSPVLSLYFNSILLVGHILNIYWGICQVFLCWDSSTDFTVIARHEVPKQSPEREGCHAAPSLRSGLWLAMTQKKIVIHGSRLTLWTTGSSPRLSKSA